MIIKARFKAGALLDDTRFAPYAGDIVFIIYAMVLIHDEQIITDFDVDFYWEIFEVIETIKI